jgi:hypothetical protein
MPCQRRANAVPRRRCRSNSSRHMAAGLHVLGANWRCPSADVSARYTDNPAADAATEDLVVEFVPADEIVHSDECMRVYGIASGTTSVQRILTGATNDVPLVMAYAREPTSKDQYGTSCAPAPGNFL